MHVRQLLKDVLIFSAIPAGLSAIGAGIWLGLIGVVAVIGAWLISSFNLMLLFRDGIRTLAQPKGLVRKVTQRAFRKRLLWVGLLLLGLDFILSPYLNSVVLGLLFLVVYTSGIVVFAWLVTRQSDYEVTE
ncbi:MAG: hypothetical protein GX030_05565 [Firmicutes bacterium]|nr:hypothetical protein [Bacillota bacterium]